LDALRARLAAQDLTGFIVPRADEHQGEYVAPSAQRLAWLTGFTGSAGAAVVLADRAAVFVDGRYTLQVKTEVEAALYQTLHLIDHPPARWLAEVLRPGDRLGFDPWLHTEDQAQKLRQACERAGARLVAVEANPVDAIWLDRPSPPLGRVVAHPQEWAGRGAAEKRAEIAQSLAADKLDAVVITQPDSIAWLLNVRGSDVDYAPLPLSFAILHADGGLDWFIDPAKLDQPLAQETEPCRRAPGELETRLAELGRQGQRVRVDPATLPARLWRVLSDAGAKLDRGADPCQLPKAIKTEAELAGMRAAHLRDGAAMVRFLAWLEDAAASGDLDEMAAADRLEEFRAAGENFRGLSFPTISGAGPNGAIVHYRSTAATNRKLAAGELYLLDSGAQYLDGTTDVTRTIAIGKAGAEERHRFTLVLKGHMALAQARFPTGTTGSQLDVLARAPLWREGLDYDHGTGHGVGSYLSVHEGPQRISKIGNPVALRPGMVLSNEPGYYKTGAYGIRIENLVAVTDLPAPPGAERDLLGFETLTLVPIDRQLIDAALLSEAEIGWINAYHGRVRALVGPLLDEAATVWLDRATAPILPLRPGHPRARARR
jgi:Xaa-Pro aminopeptidase